MHVTITGRHYKATETIRRYVQEKAPKLEKYYPGLLDLHVVLSLEKFRATVELAALAKHLKVSARTQGHTMQEAFDETYAKLAEQLRRHHDKHRRAAHRGELLATQPQAEEPAE